uniref:Peptidase S1 domain-containing protein n=1 Tax=Clastoptera arizonana TaxID=38151 RepID=A0A1B6E201_9HEMI
MITNKDQIDEIVSPDLIFERERLTFLQWLFQLLGSWVQPPEQEKPPEPIDPASCEPCTCGLANKKRRIVGGHVTYVNQYPWMALLLYNSKFYCGATLINSKYLLTAAHCINGFRKTKITVRIFEHDRDSDNETKHFDRKLRRIIKHSSYSDDTFNNDIALLALDEEVKIENDLRPVCLPPAKKSFSGVTGIVTGWGVKKTGGSTSPTLQEVQVPIMSNDDCKKTAYGKTRITENMLCAGFPEGEKDSCQGDSGGPLHILNDTEHSIAGVVSWGEGCAQKNHPGVYTRVNRYLTWIKKNTQDACYCQDFEDV